MHSAPWDLKLHHAISNTHHDCIEKRIIRNWDIHQIKRIWSLRNLTVFHHFSSSRNDLLAWSWDPSLYPIGEWFHDQENAKKRGPSRLRQQPQWGQRLPSVAGLVQLDWRKKNWLGVVEGYLVNHWRTAYAPETFLPAVSIVKPWAPDLAVLTTHECEKIVEPAIDWEN